MAGYENPGNFSCQRIQAPTIGAICDSIPSVMAPAIYAGDINCQHIDWGYNHTTPYRVALSEWASNTDALLLYDPKVPSTSFLHAGTPPPTRTCPLPSAAATTRNQRDASLTGSFAHITGLPSLKSHHWWNQYQGNISNNGTWNGQKYNSPQMLSHRRCHRIPAPEERLHPGCR